MKIESSIQVAAPAAAVFALYADVPNWPRWDKDVKSATLDGVFKSGATGVVVPNGGPKSTLTFHEVRPSQGFIASCKLPLCVMRFEHELSPREGGTFVTHRVLFQGLLAPIFGRLIGSGMRKSLPHVLANLKQLAEAS
jgi:hypothetical protein